MVCALTSLSASGEIYTLMFPAVSVYELCLPAGVLSFSTTDIRGWMICWWWQRGWGGGTEGRGRRSMLCIVGGLASSLASTYYVPVSSPPCLSHDNKNKWKKKCLDIAEYPLEGKILSHSPSPQWESLLYSNMSSETRAGVMAALIVHQAASCGQVTRWEDSWALTVLLPVLESSPHSPTDLVYKSYETIFIKVFWQFENIMLPPFGLTWVFRQPLVLAHWKMAALFCDKLFKFEGIPSTNFIDRALN